MRTKQLLNVLQVLSWIIFVGLCIDAGSFLLNVFFAWFNPSVLPRLMLANQVDLSDLLKHNPRYFTMLVLFMSVAAILKATLFYRIILLFQNKQLDMALPFTHQMGRFMVRLSYLALLIGLVSWTGIKYIGWLVASGVQMPDTYHLSLNGGDVWLFMGVTLLVLAQIFKRGIELQSENDLTI